MTRSIRPTPKLIVAPALAAQLSFVAALAVHDAVRPLVSEAARQLLSLKWPNDVLIGGDKVAGILAETAAVPGTDAMTIAVGCGLNLAHVPSDLPYPATCLARHGATADRDEVFEKLADAMSKQLAAWSDGRGFDVIRQCWLAQAAGLGGRAAVGTGKDRLEGTFINLAADGALLLRLDAGEQRAIHGGEVSFADIENSRSRPT